MSQIDTTRYTDRLDRVIAGPSAALTGRNRPNGVTARPTRAVEGRREEIGEVAATPSRATSQAAEPREADLAPLKGLSRDRLVARLARISAQIETALGDTTSEDARLSLQTGHDMIDEAMRRLRLIRTDADAYSAGR